MKTLLPILVVYFYATGNNPFFCHIKYKKEGTTQVRTESCVWAKGDTLKKRIEELTGDEVELVKVNSL